MDKKHTKNSMLISTAFGTFLSRYTKEAAVDLICNAGFDAIDFSFFSREEFYSKDSNPAYFTDLRKYAENKGIIFNQAHAPFRQPNTAAETDLLIYDIVQSIKNSALLGAGIIVVHPLAYLSDNPEELFELNMQFFTRLKPYCEEYNVKVALENMWEYKKCMGSLAVTHSVCSRPAEFIKYLDELNSDCFVGCLDIGHACLVREDPAEFIKKLGNSRLKALHVHDVNGTRDLHTAPYYGGMADWDSVAQALKEINYDGEFTYEAGNFLTPLPKELYPCALKLMAEIAKHITEKTLQLSK